MGVLTLFLVNHQREKIERASAGCDLPWAGGGPLLTKNAHVTSP
jgi:hypothetical protein